MGTFEVETIPNKDIETGKFYYEKLSGKLVLVIEKVPIALRENEFVVHYVMYNDTTGTYDTHQLGVSTLGII